MFKNKTFTTTLMKKIINIFLILFLSFGFLNLVVITNANLNSFNGTNPIYINGNVALSNYISNENLPGNGTLKNPYIIQNYVFNGDGSNPYAMKITNTNSYLKIINNTITNSNYGIIFQYCYNAIVANNSIISTNIGVHIQSSNIKFINNSILNSNVEGMYLLNNYGINISSNYFNFNNNRAIHIYNSQNSVIQDNIILNTDEIHSSPDGIPLAGIVLDSSSKIIIKSNIIAASPSSGISTWGTCSNISINSNILQNSAINLQMNTLNLTIRDNIIGSYSGYIGLHSSGSPLVENNTFFESNYPIFASLNSNFSIKNNFICDSSHGISIQESQNNIISGNTFTNITSDVFYIHAFNGIQSIGNKIYLNNFIDRKNTIFQDNIDNQWSDSTKGNYWGSYNGVDQNNDSIGDTSYSINNSRNVTVYDNFPLINPINPINNTNKISYAKNLLLPYGDFYWGFSSSTSYINGYIPTNPYIQSSSNTQTNSYTQTNSIGQSNFVSTNSLNFNTNDILTLLIILLIPTLIGVTFIYNRKNSSRSGFNNQTNSQNNSIFPDTKPENISINDKRARITKMCSNCGSFLEKTDTFCQNCGNRV